MQSQSQNGVLAHLVEREFLITEHSDFAKLTNIIYQAWSGMTKREYMDFKGLHKESLRDNMTPVELMLNGLAEAATTEISQDRNPQTFGESAQIKELIK